MYDHDECRHIDTEQIWSDAEGLDVLLKHRFLFSPLENAPLLVTKYCIYISRYFKS